MPTIYQLEMKGLVERPCGQRVCWKCCTLLEGEGREENTDVEEREKERERGSNLRRQRLASPTAQVLVAQTTQPVQKNRLRDEL